MYKVPLWLGLEVLLITLFFRLLLFFLLLLLCSLLGLLYVYQHLVNTWWWEAKDCLIPGTSYKFKNILVTELQNPAFMYIDLYIYCIKIILHYKTCHSMLLSFCTLFQWSLIVVGLTCINVHVCNTCNTHLKCLRKVIKNPNFTQISW